MRIGTWTGLSGLVLLGLGCGDSGATGAQDASGGPATGATGPGGAGAGGADSGGNGGSATGGTANGGTGGEGASLPNGAACTSASACGSGFCSDDVCCDQACEGICEACAGPGGVDGQCAPFAVGTDPDDECDDKALECTTGECGGASGCQLMADGAVCRASGGECDIAEVCAAGDCAPDALLAAGTGCRAAAGDCDVPETCDGVAATCPTDLLSDAAVVCRGSADVCDVEELCTGMDVGCPADAKEVAGASCRGIAGVCDVQEVCDGFSDTCPADSFVPFGTVASCAPFVCDGLGANCPSSCMVTAQCALGSICVTGACQPAKRVFITTTSYTGSLGGLVGANDKCQLRADTANLGGSWKAWLSTNAGSPATTFVQHPGPYALLDGTKIADNWADLTDGGLDAGISRTEFNSFVPTQSVRIWTGTHVNGQGSLNNCTNFTNGASQAVGETGLVGFTSSAWTVGGDSCNQSWRLYCFEQ